MENKTRKVRRFTVGPMFGGYRSPVRYEVIDDNYVDMDCDGVVCDDLTRDQATQIQDILNAFPAVVGNRLPTGWCDERAESLQDDLRRLVQNDVTCVYLDVVQTIRDIEDPNELADRMVDHDAAHRGQG